MRFKLALIGSDSHFALVFLSSRNVKLRDGLFVAIMNKVQELEGIILDAMDLPGGSVKVADRFAQQFVTVGDGWLMDYFVKFAIEYDMIITLNIF